MNLIEFLKDMPVIGILRDIPRGEEEACVKTAASCGLKAIEVTMNTDGAEGIIKDLKAAARPYGISYMQRRGKKRCARSAPRSVNW